MSEKIEDKVKRIRERDESTGLALSKPLEAFKAGYHENAIILCGSVIQSVLRSIWHREGIVGEADSLSAAALLERVRDRISDTMIAQAFEEIASISGKVDEGEHIPFEDAFEFLRKTCSVVLWYVEKYKTNLPQSKVSKKLALFGIGLAVILTASISLVAAKYIYMLSETSEIVENSAQNEDQIYAKITLPNGQKPQTDEDWQKVAYECIDNDNNNGALYCFTKAIELNRAAKYLGPRSYIYLHMGLYDKALPDALEMVDREPEWHQAHHTLALVYLYTKKLEKAKKHLKIACELGLQEACDDFNKHFPKETASVKYLGLTLSNGRKPETDRDWLIIGESFFDKKDYDGAVYCATKAVEINRTHINLGCRAMSYLSGGQYKKAEADAIAALKINPDYDYGNYVLGLIFYRTNQFENARQYFEKACSLGDSDGCEFLKQLPDKTE